MSMDAEITRQIAEGTARKIKRQLQFYMKALRGRHKRMLGGLAGAPITRELADADTILRARLKDPRIAPNYRTMLETLLTTRVEPFEDLYHDGLIAEEDILYGKTRATQHEVIDVGTSSEDIEEEAEEDESE